MEKTLPQTDNLVIRNKYGFGYEIVTRNKTVRLYHTSSEEQIKIALAALIIGKELPEALTDFVPHYTQSKPIAFIRL